MYYSTSLLEVALAGFRYWVEKPARQYHLGLKCKCITKHASVRQVGYLLLWVMAQIRITMGEGLSIEWITAIAVYP